MIQFGCSTNSNSADLNINNSSQDDSSVTLTYPIVDTGVKESYSDTDVIPKPKEGDPFYGQDSNYSGNEPSYTDNGDGTVTDNVTGLMWMKDMGEKMTWEEAMAYAETCTFAGYNDWRVPSIKELYSLILFTGTSGGEKAGERLFIDTRYFNQPLGDVTKGEREIDAQTWSSTVYVGKVMNGQEAIFGVNFVDGRIKAYPKYKPGTKRPNAMYVRLVRGNPEYGKNNFIDNGDGTITDLATGLMWQKNDSGVGLNWQEALAYAENLELAGYKDWRLPNAKELHSIVDYTRSPGTTGSAAIDPLFNVTPIKDIKGNKQYPYFWTSTTHLDGKNPYSSAAYIAFGYAQGIMNNKLMDVHGAGAQRSDPKSGNKMDYPQAWGPQGDIRMVYNYVRCVRTVDLSSLNTKAEKSQAQSGNTDEVSPFSFVVMADTHMDEETDFDILYQTFHNIVKSSPAFIMDLGDTLMFGDYGETLEEMRERALFVSEKLSPLKNIPIYFVTGNHDGENGFRPKQQRLSRSIRNEYFPMPSINSSFSGDTKNANYYAFEYENVLFVVLDAFTFTTDSSAGWSDTLGLEQYQWLESILKNSKCDTKFVFVHHLLGGIDVEHRGGAQASKYFEWGGRDLNGSYTFNKNRVDFTMPIHELLVQNHVTAVFHGHDHFYANEQRDGIHYILVPQPGISRIATKKAVEYGYNPDDTLPSAGFLNISIESELICISYIKTDKNNGDFTVADEFTIQRKN
jgi:hypothetical protein